MLACSKVNPPPNSPACNAAVTTSLRLTWRSFRRVGSYEGRSRYLAAVVHRHGSRHANRDNGDRASGLGHRQDHGDCLPTIAHPHSPYGQLHHVPPPRTAMHRALRRERAALWAEPSPRQPVRTTRGPRLARPASGQFSGPPACESSARISSHQLLAIALVPLLTSLGPNS